MNEWIHKKWSSQTKKAKQRLSASYEIVSDYLATVKMGLQISLLWSPLYAY